MLKLQEKIKNLETILNQDTVSSANRQTLLKEIKRLKQELNAINRA